MSIGLLASVEIPFFESRCGFCIYVETAIHHAQVFLFVAENGSSTYDQIEQALNLSNATVSRTVHALGDIHRRGYDGYGLLETFRDPDEGRRFLVRLTAKGHALVRQLKKL